MRQFDLSRWAVAGVKDDTGSGRMAQDLMRCLSPIRQLVIPSYRRIAKPLTGNDIQILCDGTDEEIRGQINGLQGIIVCEDVSCTARIIRAAHAMGVKVVFIVLWEYFRFYIPEWQMCDLFVCPNAYALKVVKKYRYKNAVQLTWPVDTDKLPKRLISGPARQFIHNVGLLEKDDRKGTELTLKAFSRVPNKNIELIVRIQNEMVFPISDSRIRVEARHLENYGDLYGTGDVAVQPSKCEGLGFMLLEAIASGLPLLTTDYPPMNEYVQQKRMRVKSRLGKYPAEQTSYVGQAHLKIPRVSDLAKKIAWCAENDLSEISRSNLTWAEEKFDQGRVRSEWVGSLEELLS